MTRLRCALLDDYQRVALSMADWRSLADRVDVVPFHERLATEDDTVRAIGDCQVVVAMRERTPFRASLFARLPRLRLLVSTGTRNAAIDVASARDLGITVCHTSSRPEPPAELTWALILALVKHVVAENTAFTGGGPWQHTLGSDLHGRHLGLLGLGKIGQRLDSPLRALPNVLGTPHLGYVSAAGYRTYYGEALEDIRAFLDGRPIRVLS